MNLRKIKIGDVCIPNAATIDRSLSQIAYLDTSSITKNRISGIQYLDSSQAIFPSRAQRKVQHNTIIYSTVRPNQEHHGILKNPANNLIVSTGFITLDVKDNDIDPDFLYYLLSQNHITRYLHTVASNNVSAYPSLNPIDICRLEFDVPSDVIVQREIASVLESLDSKINVNEDLIRELQETAKDIFEYWFLHFNFPNERGKPYKSSGGKMTWSDKLGRHIPAGWTDGQVADLFLFNPSSSLKEGTIASYIDMDALPTEGYMIPEIQSKTYSGGVKFKNGDLLVARITPCLENGKTGLVTSLPGDTIGFGSTEFIVIRGKSKPMSGFAACLSRTSLFRKYAISQMTGTSGRKRVEARALKRFRLAYPSEDKLIQDFECLVEPYFHSATINIQQNNELHELKDWLLPLLINGQVDLKVIRDKVKSTLV